MWCGAREWREVCTHTPITFRSSCCYLERCSVRFVAPGTPSRLTRPHRVVVLVLGVLGLVISAHLVSCPGHAHVPGGEATVATHAHVTVAEAGEEDNHGPHLQHAADCGKDSVHDLFGAMRMQQALAGPLTAAVAADAAAATSAGLETVRPRVAGPPPEPERRCLFGVRLLTIICVFRI